MFDEVTEVDALDSADSVRLALLQRPELGVTFTKLHCWTLTHYSKCVFMDTDTLVSRAGAVVKFVCLGRALTVCLLIWQPGGLASDHICWESQGCRSSSWIFWLTALLPAEKWILF